MPEIGTSGSMSGDGKRSVGHRPQVTAPILNSTRPCENSTRYNRTRNFEACGHAQSKKMQKFLLRSALQPNQISFSHGLGPLRQAAFFGLTVANGVIADMAGPCSLPRPVAHDPEPTRAAQFCVMHKRRFFSMMW
jgi:hypothetical protein